MFVHINKSLPQTFDFRQVKNVPWELKIAVEKWNELKFDSNHQRHGRKTIKRAQQFRAGSSWKWLKQTLHVFNVRKSYFVLLKFISIQFKYLNTKLDDGDKSWNFRDILVLPKHSHIRFWFYKMLPKKQIKFKLSKPISLIKMLSSCGWCPEKQLNPKLVNCCCLGTESFIHNFGCTSKIEQKGKIKKP